MSIQDIRPSPQDTSNFYLANIYQATIADLNRYNVSLPTSPPPLSPPKYAVWVNSLWFLSLVISITCALLATLLQQWARRYLKVTNTRYSLHKQARIRSFFAEGVKKGHLSMAVEALPTLIHISVSLFFAGLVVFLWNVDLTVFKVVLSWICVCIVLYGSVTLIPIFIRDSPYYSPLTPLVWPFVFLILIVFILLYFGFYELASRCPLCFRCSGPARMFGHLGDWLMHVTNLTLNPAEQAALKSSSEIDARAFTWTFESLDEDRELEHFFSGLPGFHGSKVLKEPLRFLKDEQKQRIFEAAIRLLDRTFSSNLLPDRVKRRRAAICANVVDLVDTPESFPNVIRRLASEEQYGPLQSTEAVDFIRRRSNRKGEEDTTPVQAMYSSVVARVQRHDDSWFALASNELGIQETVLREYAARGDSLSLALLIYVTRQQFIHIRNTSWPSDPISEVLSAASKFNVQDTSPDLQHEFCALWNEMARDAHNGSSKIPELILRSIRNLYITLHQGTNSAPTRFSSTTGDDDFNLWHSTTYPLCNVTDHVHDGSASIPFPRPVPRDDAALSHASFVSPVTPSFPLPARFHVNESVTTVQSLDNSHPTRQTIESSHVPNTSRDRATACAMPDTVTSAIATSLPTPETSTSTPPPLSTFLLASNSLRNDGGPNFLVPSHLPDFSSLASSNPTLDSALHTGPSLCSHSPTIDLTSDRLTPRNSHRCSQRFSRVDPCD